MTVIIRQPKTDTCDHPDCESEYTIQNAVGGYCSQACADRHAGAKLLRAIRQDHRFCWSCWRALKTVETPTAEARRGLGPVTDEALVGYEDTTRHVDQGPHGLECACAAVGHDIVGWDRRDEGPYHWFLMRVVEQMREEGQHDKRLDLETFANVLWETDDLERAVGAALD